MSYRLVFAVVTCLALMGCRTNDPARERSENAVQMLVTTRTQLIASEQRVAESVDALRALTAAQGDLRPAFDAFKAKVALVHKEADRVRIEAEDMRLASDMFTTAWRNEVATIQNQQLRGAGEARAGEVRSRYDQIDKLYAEANRAFADYLTHCEDLKTYLSNDLNFPALSTAKPWLKQAETAGERLQAKLGELTTELGVTTNVLSPVPVPQHRQTTTSPSATTSTTLP